MITPPMKTKAHYSCRPGYDAVPENCRRSVRGRLRVILGNPRRSFFYERVNDYPNIPYETKVSIDALFKEVCDLTPEQIWEIWYD